MNLQSQKYQKPISYTRTHNIHHVIWKNAVNVIILLSKLETYGILAAAAQDWFSSYT